MRAIIFLIAVCLTLSWNCDDLHQGWANSFYREPHWKVHCYRGPHIFTFVYFSYHLRT